MSTILVQVAVPVPLFELFDYALPADAQVPTAGCRVRVPFGSRELIGIVMQTKPLHSEKNETGESSITEHKIKSILEVIEFKPIIPATTLDLLIWAAGYYHYPLGEVLSAALPALLRQGRHLDLLTQYWRVAPDATSAELSRSPKQRRTFDILNLHDQRGAPESILILMGVERASLLLLEKRGLVESFMQPRELVKHPVNLAHMPLLANAEQQYAIDQIHAVLGRFQGVLLDGLTGSGKTEVYLQAMQPVLEAGQQVLVLVPEIGLTPQTINRFKARFHAEIVMLHSNMSDVARLQAWQAAYTGHANIVIGTRSAVFTPMPHLGLIVIDEEHDLSYKQQDTFRYHARDVALKRGFDQKCPVLLGSATSSLESLHLAAEKKLLHLHLNERAGNAEFARIHLIDLRNKKRENGLSQPLLDAIATRLKADEQVLVFLNRRGFAPVLLCDACGWQADCPRCDAHLTVHYTPRQHLHCHHCGYQSRLPTECPACKSVNLIPTGAGTARLEETLMGHFPDHPIIRVDRDTTSRVGSWDKIYQRANQAGAAILLGTQMLAKGHHFPNVTLVAIVDVDGGFLSVDFRAPERMAQLILQVAGRAGRGTKTGQVLIQTRYPENPLLLTLIRQGYGQFAQEMLQERRSARLPPYRHAALIRAESPNAEKTEVFLKAAIEAFKRGIEEYQQRSGQMISTPHDPNGLEIWGPIPAPMEKRAGVFRGHVLIQCAQRKLLHHLIEPWWPAMMHLPERRGVRASLDVDPMELS
ncbi:primosomal protein N' [Aquirhabdus sp.]|uniref:primosomal protein N' n=1 Tax=Aquirhabdus sp. TaxID=2824160 RepID=UPI00396CE882